jgi:hypothetical protein
VLALRDLQRQFVQALFDDTDGAVLANIDANGIDPDQRLDIYRNNLCDGFTKALAIGFPVIERLVGTDYFRQLARQLLRAHPSRAGNLHHIGAPFSGFLREHFSQTEYAYLADVAALEWAHQEALVAADAEALSVDALRAIDSTLYESLRFTLHPACGLVRSPFPVVHIWRANQPEASGDEVINLDSGGDNVLVLRAAECIEFHRLPMGEFALLEAFARHETLGAAFESACAADTSLDLGSALRHFLNLHIFTGIASRVASAAVFSRNDTSTFVERTPS